MSPIESHEIPLKKAPKTNRVWHFVERFPLIGIVGLFFAPLSLSLILRFQPEMMSNSPWLRNETLSGMTIKPPLATCSWSTVRCGQYQESLAQRFNSGFAAREILIRLTCESWYRIFGQSPLTSGIVLGKDDCLFTDYHLSKYCLKRIPSEQLEPIVQKLQRLQDACDKTGTAFIVLITPNKASIETEYIPETWLRRYDPRPTAYDQFVPLLKKHGVRFVDGHALTLEAKANAAAPVFPKGGIHWGSPVAFHTTHALLRALQAQGKPLQPLEHEALSLSDIPQGDDADLMRLMNLVVPWRYPVASLQVKPRKPLSGDLGFYVTFVGGSFTTAVAEQLSASGQFSEVNSFFYYKQDKRSFGGGALKAMKSPVDQVDLATEVFASDFLVLEINESFLDFSDRRYAITFVDDALRYLKKSEKLVKFPFLREGEQYLECQLGHEISFRSDNHPFGKTRDCLTGFAECDVSATWTDGPTATLRLSILPPDRDLLLEVKAGALFHPPQLPEQVIEVYANNQFIGKWKIAVAGETGQQATIPKNFVSDGGKLTLRFEIENPMSPASLGMGDDPRKLGIWFSSMRLSEAMAAED